MGAEAGPPPAPLVEFVRALPAVGEALDLGCGDGRLSAELPAERVVGADVSQVALERARVRVAEVVPLAPDEPLPFADNRFEVVLCAETIEHVRDVQLLMSEARRVLRPGGTLALTTPAHSRRSAARLVLRGWESAFDPLSPHLRFFSVRSLRRLLVDMGFEVESLRNRSGTLLARARR